MKGGSESVNLHEDTSITRITVDNYFRESIELQKAILSDAAFFGSLSDIVQAVSGCFKEGRKVLVAGNGGSAADAQHFAAEMVVKFKNAREQAFPVIALTVDTSILTAQSNDFNYDSVFSRQVQALGREDDILIVISTSGNSKNLIKAAKTARVSGMKIIGLLGMGGGPLMDTVDIPLVVPSSNVPRIQEMHEMLLHIICEEVEKKLIWNKESAILTEQETEHENHLPHVFP